MPRSLRLLVAVIVTIGIAISASYSVGARASLKKGKTMEERPHPLMVTLHGGRTYLAGFPIIVAVEVHNVSEQDFEPLPFFDLFTVPGDEMSPARYIRDRSRAR